MILKEYWPASFDRTAPPKVWRINTRSEALKIDFIVERKGVLSKDGHSVLNDGGLVIGVFMNDDGTPLEHTTK